MKADRVSASKLGAPRRVMKAGSGRTVLVGPLQVDARLWRREITPIKTLTGFISGANSTCRASSSIPKPLWDAIYLWPFAGHLKHLYQCSQASAGTKRTTRLTTSIYVLYQSLWAFAGCTCRTSTSFCEPMWDANYTNQISKWFHKPLLLHFCLYTFRRMRILQWTEICIYATQNFKWTVTENYRHVLIIIYNLMCAHEIHYACIHT